LIGAAKEQDMEYQLKINIVQDDKSLVTKTLWLWYNRWDKKFAEQDMNMLHKLMDLPLATETAETIISDAIARILSVC